jgi:ornithine carbamoyltransferase
LKRSYNINFLKISDLSHTLVDKVLDVAHWLECGQTYDTLKGKTCIAFFPESSIRTRISFEMAVRKLGGEFILFPSSTLDKREDFRDVIGYIQNWADLCIIRHGSLAALETIAGASRIPIINAMTSSNHPCEILGDLYSLAKIKGSFKNLVYTFVGAPGNIFNSWLEAADYFGFKLNHVSLEINRVATNSKFYNFYSSLDDVIASTDILLTDPLPNEFRNEAYYQKYQITGDVLWRAKKGILLNPCPPFYRGEEVSQDAIESAHFVGYGFKKSLLAVQQALVHQCMLE